MHLIRLLALAAVALMASGVSAKSKVWSGRKWIKLIGRRGCTDSSGFLGGNTCKGTDSLVMLQTGSAQRATWRMKPAPGSGSPADLVGVRSSFQLVGRSGGKGACKPRSFLAAPSRCTRTSAAMGGQTFFVLERAPAVAGQPQGAHGQFYIRAASRGKGAANCRAQYLGALAAPKGAKGKCGNPRLGMYPKAKNSSVLLVWTVIPRDSPKAPPPPPPPPPSPPPPGPPPLQPFIIDNNGYASAINNASNPGGIFAACGGMPGDEHTVSANQWVGFVFISPGLGKRALTKFGMYLSMAVGTYDILASLYLVDFSNKPTGAPLYSQVQRYNWLLNSPSFDDWNLGIGGIDWKISPSTTYAAVFSLTGGGPFVSFLGCALRSSFVATQGSSYLGYVFSIDSGSSWSFSDWANINVPAFTVVGT